MCLLLRTRQHKISLNKYWTLHFVATFFKNIFVHNTLAKKKFRDICSVHVCLLYSNPHVFRAIFLNRSNRVNQRILVGSIAHLTVAIDLAHIIITNIYLQFSKSQSFFPFKRALITTIKRAEFD